MKRFFGATAAVAIVLAACNPVSAPPATSGDVLPTPAPSPSGLSGLWHVEGVEDPVGLALDPEPALWVVGGASGSVDPAGRVRRMAETGAPLLDWTLPGEGGPCACDASGSVWVLCGLPAPTLWRLTPTASESWAIAPGLRPAEPVSLSVDASGSVWIADAANDRLLRHDAGGPDLAVSLSLPVGAHPAGVVAHGDWVWVAIAGSPEIRRYARRDGSPAGTVTVEAEPSGPMTFDVNGFLWAAHGFFQGTSTLAKIKSDLTVLSHADTLAEEPGDVAADARGYVWTVLRSSSRVLRLTPANGDMLIYQDAAIAHPGPLVLDSQGNAWVASPGAIAKIPAAP